MIISKPQKIVWHGGKGSYVRLFVPKDITDNCFLKNADRAQVEYETNGNDQIIITVSKIREE